MYNGQYASRFMWYIYCTRILYGEKNGCKENRKHLVDRPNTNDNMKPQGKIVLSFGSLLSDKGDKTVKYGSSNNQHRPNAEPPEDLHDINTNDLESLIETKQHQMKKLKAEESVLLERRRAYSTSSDNPVLTEIQKCDKSNRVKKVSVKKSSYG